MNAKCKVNWKGASMNTTFLVVRGSRPPGAFLLIVILLMAVKSLSVSAVFEPPFPQGMNPEQVAGAIKANAQA